MNKWQDKPDCFGEINEEIMDNMLLNRENIITLVGSATEIMEIEQLYGIPFNGIKVSMETPRIGGTKDKVTVVALKRDVDIAKGTITEAERGYKSKIMVTGKVQALRDTQTGRMPIFVLADYVVIVPEDAPLQAENEVVMRGTLANTPRFRTTPRQKKIADLMIMVHNELTGKKCSIPCICWGEYAEKAANWQQDDTVELMGRFQSREYSKVIDFETGEAETRTAYEVSAKIIRRKEQDNEQENESNN